jgi:hypothetical protein
LINGGSELEQIKGTSEFIYRRHTGGLGGHYINTWYDDLNGYWKEIGKIK